MVTKMSKVLASLVVMLFLTACQGTANIGREGIMSCSFDNFINLDDMSRRRTIVQCEPNQQVELYLAWSSYTIPSNTDYAEVIARSGERLISPLLSRLEKNDHLSDEIKKPELLIILDIMQRAGYYNVAADVALVERIDNAVSQISEVHIKEWALDIVSKIKASGPTI